MLVHDKWIIKTNKKRNRGNRSTAELVGANRVDRTAGSLKCKYEFYITLTKILQI